MAKLGSFNEAVPSGGRAVFTAYNKKIADDIANKLSAPRRGFDPSPNQQAIFDWVRNPVKLDQWDNRRNAVVEAVAGSGKTTTMVEVCRLLNMQVSSATFHSIGLRAWRTVAPSAQVKGEKIEDIMEERDVPRNLRAFVGRLVSLAKQRGIWCALPDNKNGNPWEDTVEHFDLEDLLPIDVRLSEALEVATDILEMSIDTANEVIDFEDMIYMPLHANVTIPQYDWVIVDELQDTNPTRRELAKRMLAPSGRFIGVGDPHQAIYGFTGADNDAMETIVRELDCVRLPLTVTYRCAEAIVNHAKQWVSHIEAREGASQGAVRRVTQKDFNWMLDTTRTALGLHSDRVTTEDAILCRNTKPLIETAFDMIRRRIPCHVEGRDIGQGLVALIKKWKSARTIAELRDKLEIYLEVETEKFRRRGRKDKIASLSDKVGTLFVFMASLHDDDSTYKLIESVNSLFKDTETGKKAATVTLSTVHKSKGREWSRVFLLGRNALMPSPYAKLPWQLEQEANLCYVAVTRAMNELIEVDFPIAGENDEPLGGGEAFPTGEDFRRIDDLRHFPAVQGATILTSDYQSLEEREALRLAEDAIANGYREDLD